MKVCVTGCLCAFQGPAAAPP